MNGPTCCAVIIGALILASCGSDNGSTESETETCADPCDVVSYQRGFSVQSVSCMGDLLDSDVSLDNFGRTTYLKLFYANGSIEIDNVNYNNLGQPLSYSVVRRWNSDVLRRDVVLSYDNLNQLENVTCS